MTAIVGTVLAILVAVAGWIVNQALARRAIRRNMRIEYLLTAYRRLESVSNRRMAAGNELELEAAISDIQLLGTRTQVEIASEFARQFAAEGRADSEPLLDDLRTSLRQELLLDPLEARRVVLRVSDGRDTGTAPSVANGSWAFTYDRVVTDLHSNRDSSSMDARDPVAMPAAGVLGQDMNELIEQSPLAAVGAAHDRLGQQLLSLLRDSNPTDVPKGNVSELAVAAHQRYLISQSSRDAVEGLGVMHMLALLDDGSNHLDEKRAREYVTLTEATSYAMRQDAANKRRT